MSSSETDSRAPYVTAYVWILRARRSRRDEEDAATPAWQVPDDDVFAGLPGDPQAERTGRLGIPAPGQRVGDPGAGVDDLARQLRRFDPQPQLRRRPAVDQCVDQDLVQGSDKTLGRVARQRAARGVALDEPSRALQVAQVMQGRGG